jgi:Ca2+-binding RTX toxin-like protein
MDLLFLAMIAAVSGLFLFNGGDDPEEAETGEDTSGGEDPIITSFGDLLLSQTEDGNATIYGGAGDDVYHSERGVGDAIDDYVSENGLTLNALHAGDGNDSIYSTDHNALSESDDGGSIFGGAGDDTIYSQFSDVDGGTGNDSIRLDLNYASAAAHGGDGDDHLSVVSYGNGHEVGPTAHGFALHGDAGNDTLSGFAGDFFGGDGNDSILVNGTFSGTSNADGGAGDDTISVDRMVHYY